MSLGKFSVCRSALVPMRIRIHFQLFWSMRTQGFEFWWPKNEKITSLLSSSGSSLRCSFPWCTFPLSFLVPAVVRSVRCSSSFWCRFANLVCIWTYLLSAAPPYILFFLLIFLWYGMFSPVCCSFCGLLSSFCCSTCMFSSASPLLVCFILSAAPSLVCNLLQLFWSLYSFCCYVLFFLLPILW